MIYFLKTHFQQTIRLILLIGLMGVVGCVSKKIEPEHKPRLGVSQSSEGWLTFRLETEIGYKYKILYEDPSDRVWKPVKGCESIMGTGEPVEIKKKFNSRKAVPPFTVSYSTI